MLWSDDQLSVIYICVSHNIHTYYIWGLIQDQTVLPCLNTGRLNPYSFGQICKIFIVVPSTFVVELNIEQCWHTLYKHILRNLGFLNTKNSKLAAFANIYILGTNTKKVKSVSLHVSVMLLTQWRCVHIENLQKHACTHFCAFTQVTILTECDTGCLHVCVWMYWLLDTNTHRGSLEVVSVQQENTWNH